MAKVPAVVLLILHLASTVLSAPMFWSLRNDANHLATIDGLDGNTIFPRSFHGRGAMSLVACAAPAPKSFCSVYYNEYYDHLVSWSLQSHLTPSSLSSGSSFGASVAGDTETAVIGSPGTPGAAYVFRGKWTYWSQQQVLTAKSSKSFGSSVALTGDSLLIGAPLDDDKGVGAGSVYLFKSNKPKSFWSLQQQLFAKEELTTDSFGNSIVAYGDNAAIVAPGDVGTLGTYPGSVYIFSAGECNWSQQQKLSTGAISGWNAYVAMYGKYLVIGSPGVDVVDGTGTTQAAAGAVFVYKLSSNPNARFKFSYLQRIVQDVPSAGSFLGNSVSMYGTTFFVGAENVFGSGDLSGVYVYTVTGKGTFSESQILQDPSSSGTNYINPTLNGVNALISHDTPDIYYYTPTSNWSCLVVSLADQFGDGWGGANLVITAPDGSTDSFAPYCSSRNPFTFRYCPSLPTDTGIYTLAVPKAPEAPFFWEIYWSVEEELTGKIYNGDHATRIRFVFDSQSASFNFTSADHLLNNSTCKVCPGQPPKPKPKAAAKLPDVIAKPAPVALAAPKVFRRIQQTPTPTGKPTVVPTAWPTLNSSAMGDWHWLHLQDSAANGWFEADGKGTSFYISDPDGKQLKSAGTLCPDMFSYQCWQPLLDGTYILRLGGGLDVNSGDHTWSFCGKTGGAQTQLLFQIADGTCTPLMTLSKHQYCVEGGARTLLKGKILLKGMDNDTDLTAGDKLLLDQVIASLTSVLKSSDVSVDDVHFVGSENGHEVSFTASVSSLTGYDGRYYDSMEALKTLLTSELSTAVLDGQMLSSLNAESDMTTTDSGLLKGVDSISLLDLYVADMDFSAQGKSENQGSSAEFAEDSSSVSHSASESSSGIDSTYLYSFAGLMVVLMSVLALVVFRRQRDSTASQLPDESFRGSDESMTSKYSMDNSQVALTKKDVTSRATFNVSKIVCVVPNY